jgi:hypothetical protein
MRKCLCILSFTIFISSLAVCDEQPAGSNVPLFNTSQFQFYVPNGTIDVLFKENILNSDIDFKTAYDYIDDYIHTDLDISYPLKHFILGINMNDKVDFNQLFNDESTLQRSRHLKPYFGYKLTDKTSVVTSTRFQDTYTVSITSQAVLDSGKNIVQSLGIHFDNLSKGESLSSGDMLHMDFSKSFSQLGSQYDYTLAELSFMDITRPFLNHYLETEVFMGYPVSVIKEPITELYYLGGPDRMKGYSYNEFSGDATIYSGIKYHIPFTVKEHFLKTQINFLSVDFLAELGKTGTSRIYEVFDDYKADVGLGFSFDITILNRIQAKISSSIDQAIYSKEIRYYLMFSAITYNKG